VAPSRGVPEIDGAVAFAGGRASIAALGPEVTVALPAALVAVTRTRRRAPTSAGAAL
jgi:hypothetical protein